jgi:hypothetical protein
MALGLALSITEDDLAIARECERLDGEPGFFTHLTGDRRRQRLAQLDAAARQRIDPLQRRRGPAHDQHSPGAENGRTDRQIRPRGISSRIRDGVGQGPVPFGYDAGKAPVVRWSRKPYTPIALWPKKPCSQDPSSPGTYR